MQFTILFVDDDNQVRPAVTALLRAEGFRVFEAASNREALDILERERVDVLFTDVVMPDEDGIALAKRARQLRPSIRVLFATGYYSRARSAEEHGKLIFKPARAHEIRSALTDVLGGVHKAEENMRDAGFYRGLARQCRALLKDAHNPELLGQLKAWALECDRQADRALRECSGEDIRQQARRYEQRAAEYRAVADQMQNSTSRASFRHLAATYEAMARRLEARAERTGRRRAEIG